MEGKAYSSYHGRPTSAPTALPAELQHAAAARAAAAPAAAARTCALLAAAAASTACQQLTIGRAAVPAAPPSGSSAAAMAAIHSSAATLTAAGAHACRPMTATSCVGEAASACEAGSSGSGCSGVPPGSKAGCSDTQRSSTSACSHRPGAAASSPAAEHRRKLVKMPRQSLRLLQRRVKKKE